MADITKPFMFVDWDETTYDLERGGRIAPGVEGLSVFYQVTEFDDISGQIESINGLSYSLLRPYMCSGCQIEIDTDKSAPDGSTGFGRARLRWSRSRTKRSCGRASLRLQQS
jgi:hypothetical protein